MCISVTDFKHKIEVPDADKMHLECTPNAGHCFSESKIPPALSMYYSEADKLHTESTLNAGNGLGMVVVGWVGGVRCNPFFCGGGGGGGGYLMNICTWEVGWRSSLGYQQAKCFDPPSSPSIYQQSQ